jgi:hypothetical protein
MQAITEAMRPIHAEYRETIRTYAAEILARETIRAAGGEDLDVEEAIHEYADESEWVIYTYAAQAVLLMADNHDAIEDAGEMALHDGGVNWSVLAYLIMRSDLEDEIAFQQRASESIAS